MYVDADDLDQAGSYRLLVGSVVPRPIAWVTSGRAPKPVNLAPFSAFTWVSQYPAMLGITVSRRQGEQKDTLRNIEEDGAFVVNIADEPMLDVMHASSQFHPPDTSEAALLGLATAPSVRVDVPRLRDVPVSMECVYERTVAFSETGGELVVGRVVAWHVRDEATVAGRIETELLRPLGRLAGSKYTTLGDVTELPRMPGG